MDRKIKLLFCMDTLDMTGASASLVSLLRVLDYSKYDVSLFLFAQQGAYLSQVPPEVTILPVVPAYYMATAPLAQAVKTGIRRGWLGLVARRVLALALGRRKAGRVKMDIAIRGPKLPDHYDIAIAYCCSYVWKFIVDKVDATRRVAWLDTAHNRVSGAWNAYACPKQWDVVACVCQDEVLSLVRDEPELNGRVCCVHNIIRRDLIDGMKEAYKPVLPSGVLTISTIGRITDQKGQDLIVEIARLLRRKGIGFKWYLVGPGAEKWDNFCRLCNATDVLPCIEYAGPMSNPLPYAKYCDLYVQPSRWEGWGLTVTEALACGAPVMVSDIPAFREQIVDGENGWIVPLDVNAFAEKIEAFSKGKLKLSCPGKWLDDYSHPVEFDEMCARLMEIET